MSLLGPRQPEYAMFVTRFASCQVGLERSEIDNAVRILHDLEARCCGWAGVTHIAGCEGFSQQPDLHGTCRANPSLAVAHPSRRFHGCPAV